MNLDNNYNNYPFNKKTYQTKSNNNTRSQSTPTNTKNNYTNYNSGPGYTPPPAIAQQPGFRDFTNPRASNYKQWIPAKNFQYTPGYHSQGQQQDKNYWKNRYIRQQVAINNRFPIQDYGRMMVPRHTPQGIERWGDSWYQANLPQRQQREQDGWIGRGKYKSPLTWKNFDKIAKVVAPVAKPLLKAANDKLIGLIGSGEYKTNARKKRKHSIEHETISGRGAYDVSTNQLINTDGPSRRIRTSKDETNSITITHTEYLGDITPTSTSFQTQYFLSINPGLAATFPWLSQLAQYYEEHEFVQCIFNAKSIITEGNASASGTIIHCTQYNPANSAFQSKQAMENYEYANSHKVTDHGEHGVECDPKKHGGSKIEYVRTGALGIGQDVKTYDLGNYQLATSGCVANLAIAELWVTYTVILMKTKIPTPGTMPNLPGAVMRFTCTTPLTATPLGTPTITYDNTSGFTITGTQLTFPTNIVAGKYQLTLLFTGTTGTSPLLNATIINGTIYYGTGFPTLGAATTLTTPQFTTMIIVNTSGCVLTFAGSTLTGLTGCAGFLHQINPN